MKIRLVLILSISLCTAANSVVAQTSANQITTKFFKLYTDSPTKAIEYAFSTNKWMIDKQDAIANVKNQLENLISVVGDYYGYEKITEKTVGESLKLVSYIIKYDRQPVRFTFVFYKPANLWQVQNFQYDVDLDDELEESAKVYMLQENLD